MISQIPGVPCNAIEKLYWNRFGFKVEVAPVNGKRTGSGHFSSRIFVNSAHVSVHLIPLCPTGDDAYRSQNNGYAVCFYFTNAADTQSFIDNLPTKHFRISEVLHPVSEEHLATLSQDHKIVTRSKYFYDHFEWRIIFKRLDATQVHDLKEWVDAFFAGGEVEDRYSFTEGVNCVLYLTNEDDVVMAKLTQGIRVRKVEKVVLTNNNNKEDTHEPGSVSQTG